MATIATLKVLLTASSEKFGKGLQTAQNSLGKFRKGLAAADDKLGGFGKSLVGAFAVGAVVNKLNETAGSIDKLAKTSDKLGVPIEKLQGLQFAAEQSGLSADQMSQGLQTMTRVVSEAAIGVGEAGASLSALGLSAEKLNSLSPDQQLAQIADALQGVTNQNDRVRLLGKLFGEEVGPAMANTLAQGSAGLAEMQRQLEATGSVVDRDGARAIEEMNDAFNRASKTIDGVFKHALIAIAPVIKQMADAVSELAKNWQKTKLVMEGLWLQASGRGTQADFFRIKEAIADLDRVGKKADSLRRAAGGGAIEEIEEIKVPPEAFERLEELRRKAEQFARDALTPQEILDQKFKDLNDAFYEGFIDQKTFDRIEKKLQEEAKELIEASYRRPQRLAISADQLRTGFLERGSAGAFSRTNDNRNTFKTLGDTAKLQLVEQRQMVEVLGRIAEHNENIQLAELN